MAKDPDDLSNKNAPPPSDTKDNFSHHSSPTPTDEQEQHPAMPLPKPSIGQPLGAKVIKKTEVPMHVTKHPEPVGRPKGSTAKDTDDY